MTATELCQHIHELPDAAIDGIAALLSERARTRLEWMTRQQACQPVKSVTHCTTCNGTGRDDAPDPASGRTTGEWSMPCRDCFGLGVVALEKPRVTFADDCEPRDPAQGAALRERMERLEPLS